MMEVFFLTLTFLVICGYNSVLCDTYQSSVNFNGTKTNILDFSKLTLVNELDPKFASMNGKEFTEQEFTTRFFHEISCMFS